MSPPISAPPVRYGHSAVPIRLTAAIVSTAAGISPVASIMPTGSTARASSLDGEKPQLTAEGTPRVRAMWLPPDQATVLDTWSTIGMRGTGSQDFVVDDVFVPSAHTCFLGDPPLEAGPLYSPRLFLATAFIPVVANRLASHVAPSTRSSRWLAARVPPLPPLFCAIARSCRHALPRQRPFSMQRVPTSLTLLERYGRRLAGGDPDRAMP